MEMKNESAKNMKNTNMIVVQREEFELRISDVLLLHGDEWLNDNVIGFFLKLLQDECIKINDHVLIVSPTIAFWIAHGDANDLQLLVDELKFNTRQIVLLPVNDNEDFERGDGGSHWSLLAYQRTTNTFYHFDSLFSLNHESAENLANRTAKLLSAESFKFNSVERSPQQTNAYDCALYLMKAAELLSVKGSGMNNFDVEDTVAESVTKDEVHKMKNNFLNQILHEADDMAKQEVLNLFRHKEQTRKQMGHWPRMREIKVVERTVEHQETETEKETETERETMEKEMKEAWEEGMEIE